MRAHHVWGLEVETVELPIHVGSSTGSSSAHTRFDSEDWPEPGDVVDAVVQGYMPNGQLRLSTLIVDLARAKTMPVSSSSLRARSPGKWRRTLLASFRMAASTGSNVAPSLSAVSYAA
jgi:hypothetical protein